MSFSLRTLLVACAFVPVAWAADDSARFAGHWEGAIHALEDIPVAIDLEADDGGKLRGTFSNAAQRLSGYPLWSANVEGVKVRLELKTAGPAVQTFNGQLSDDGETIAGQFLVDVHAVPFTLKRNGAAHIAPPPRSAAIDAKFAGTWTGSLTFGSQSFPLQLTLTNHADRTATGSWAAGGAPAVPVAIEVDDATLRLTSPVTPAWFTGTLSPDGTHISGALNENGVPRPVVFTRSASGG